MSKMKLKERLFIVLIVAIGSLALWFGCRFGQALAYSGS